MTIIRKLTLNHTGVVIDASASTPFEVPVPCPEY